MIDHEYLYEQVCEAADAAAYVRSLTDVEVRKLRGRCEFLEKRNGVKGGIPGMLKWICMMVQADRMQVKS
jgi:hypothetical protein